MKVQPEKPTSKTGVPSLDLGDNQLIKKSLERIEKSVGREMMIG
jgi:hypothetical protein